jgi:hypothetical protein
MRMARFVLCAGLVGCATAAQGPDFTMAPPASELATVYIYRPANKNAGSESPDVYVGEAKLFRLQNAGYGVVLLPPGQHEVVVKNLCFPPVRQSVSARGGEQMFLRFAVADPLRPPPVESSGHWSLDLIQLPSRTAEAKKWSEEWCQLPPRFEAIEKSVASAEISQTKLVDGGSAAGVRPKQK